jgi:hypothetical protein
MEQQRIEWRREKVRELSVKGHTQRLWRIKKQGLEALEDQDLK